MLKAETYGSCADNSEVNYENVYRQSHLSSTKLQEMRLKLRLIGLIVYCISLFAFTVVLLSKVTGWKRLSALPWILH